MSSCFTRSEKYLSDDRLRNAFAFSMEDVQANENGFLTRTQEDVLKNYISSRGCGTRAAPLALVLTLVIMFIILLYNIINIVSNFLSGNVTFNFLLHFMTTITVSGTIFTYYIYQIKQDNKHHA